MNDAQEAFIAADNMMHEEILRLEDDFFYTIREAKITNESIAEILRELRKIYD